MPRRLTPEDAASYRETMLEAYELHPDAFTSSAAERAALPMSWWLARLSAEPSAHESVWGTFDGTQLTGVVGLLREAREKIVHKATLFGMYVRPSARRSGVGDALVRAVLRHARTTPPLRVVQLTVSEGNDAALALYSRHGFVQFGLEPLAVRVGAADVSKVHMWCDLDRLSS